MKLSPFNPKVTWNSIDIPRTYEYGPSIVNGRIFYVTGLSTDAITSIRLDGAKPSVPYARADKLVADPFAYKIKNAYIVYHTVGELHPDGLGNGVGYYIADGYGNPVKNSARMMIKQNGQGTYGTGQPSVALLNGHMIMFVREDGPNGVNTIGAFKLSDDGLRVEKRIYFLGAAKQIVLEDGASPEIFVYRNKLHMLVSGGGPVGIRTYEYAGGTLRRETELEQNVNGFYAQSVIHVPTIIDGAGVVRNIKNEVEVLDGHATIWYGSGQGSDAGTWRLEKGYIKLP